MKFPRTLSIIVCSLSTLSVAEASEADASQLHILYPFSLGGQCELAENLLSGFSSGQIPGLEYYKDQEKAGSCQKNDEWTNTVRPRRAVWIFAKFASNNATNHRGMYSIVADKDGIIQEIKMVRRWEMAPIEFGPTKTQIIEKLMERYGSPTVRYTTSSKSEHSILLIWGKSYQSNPAFKNRKTIILSGEDSRREINRQGCLKMTDVNQTADCVLKVERNNQQPMLEVIDSEKEILVEAHIEVNNEAVTALHLSTKSIPGMKKIVEAENLARINQKQLEEKMRSKSLPRF